MNIEYFSVVISGFLALLGAFWYARDVKNGKSRPHPMTWAIWCILTFFIFIIQIENNAGIGSSTTAIVALSCLIFSVIGFTQKEYILKTMDWVLLFYSIICIFFIMIDDSGFISTFLIVTAEISAFIPLIRKIFNDPYSEGLGYYCIGVGKFAFSAIAIAIYGGDMISLFYPLTLSFVGFLFVTMTIFLRKNYKYQCE